MKYEQLGNSAQDWRASQLANRYQNQNWLVRLWRDRWLLLIPLQALSIWWFEHCHDDSDERLTMRGAWGLAVGLCAIKRQWWYTSAEVEQQLGIG